MNAAPYTPDVTPPDDPRKPASWPWFVAAAVAALAALVSLGFVNAHAEADGRSDPGSALLVPAALGLLAVAAAGLGALRVRGSRSVARSGAAEPGTMNRLLRVGGAVGLALLAFITAAVAFNEWNQARDGAAPDWLIVVLPLLAAVPALVLALRLPPNRWALFLLSLGAAVLIGAFVGAAMVIGGRTLGGAGLWVLLIVAGLIAAAVSLPAILPWWNRTDEAARQAHLSGFFWGGTAGAVVVIPLMMAPLLQPGSIPEISELTPDEAFFAGAVTLYLAISLGYGVFWAWWWLRRR